MVGSTKCDDGSQTQQMYLRHNANVAFLTLKVPFGMKVEFISSDRRRTSQDEESLDRNTKDYNSIASYFQN